MNANNWTPASIINREQIQHYAALFRQKFPVWAQRCNGRIERAVEIATTAGACRPDEARPGVYQVRSASNPRGWYEVDMTAHTCTCPDDGKNQDRPRIICKHRLAIGFKLYGPEWAHEEQRAKYDREYAARKAADEAWQMVIGIANRYENLSPLDYDSETASSLRAALLKATDQAEALQKAYNELVRGAE